MNGLAQSRQISGEVKLPREAMPTVEIFVDNTDRAVKPNRKGFFLIDGLEAGTHTLTVFAAGYKSKTVAAETGTMQTIRLTPWQEKLNEVQVLESENRAGLQRMRYIEIDGIYASKKNEVISPDRHASNKSANNARQTFSRVAGLNVQETDAGGLQLGIGSRGLDPKRTANFNTRQNGYDISADALGYPESYYTPPIEAVEKINIVRGAASLQFGSQFGGLLNFQLKEGAADKKLELISRQTVGSYGYFGSFNSISGSAGKWKYYGYFNHKESKGWRDNNHFNANGFHTSLVRSLGNKVELRAEFTHSHYRTQQPGGLTDRMFEENPQQSFRDRNWFDVDWNIAAFTVDAEINKNNELNSRFFVLKAQRASLGFLGNITRVDPGGSRDLMVGDFTNLGNETRFLHRFDIRERPGAIILGTRTYLGHTESRQGLAPDGTGPNFTYLNPENLEGSDFTFPSANVAAFTEIMLPINSCWVITPGARWETITTGAEGYYQQRQTHPLTGDVLFEERTTDETQRNRQVFLAGVGSSYKCLPQLEAYANWSQNYRAINFNDLRVINPNLRIDPNLSDERGYTADGGIRGTAWRKALNYDVSVFYVSYANRIGEVLTTVDTENLGQQVVNFRTNIGRARYAGIEVFGEFDFLRWLEGDSATCGLSWFHNLALTDARYIQSEEAIGPAKRVEMAPQVNYKSGVNYRCERWGVSLQASYVSAQYTDASNAEFFSDGTVGIIPAYSVFDASAEYRFKRYSIEASLNNLTNATYFNRRATGYPGPGIVPAEPRMLFVTLEVRI